MLAEQFQNFPISVAKKGKRKVQGVPQSQNRSPSQTPRGRGNRQI